MREEKSRGIRCVTRAAFAFGCLLVTAFGMGCSFDPLKYFSRNACEVFNCNELFFIDDVFPLSAAPTSGAAAEEEEPAADDGEHLH